MVADDWTNGLRSVALNVRAQVRPPAEPGADEVFTAAGRVTDRALLAWIALGDTARAQHNEDQSPTADRPSDAATDDAFLDGIVYFKGIGAVFQLVGGGE